MVHIPTKVRFPLRREASTEAGLRKVSCWGRYEVHTFLSKSVLGLDGAARISSPPLPFGNLYPLLPPRDARAL